MPIRHSGRYGNELFWEIAFKNNEFENGEKKIIFWVDL
jgi:hypothetical protein